MKPTPELIDELYRERVLRARAMTVEEKFRAGPQLFAQVCRLMEAGLRDENPEATDQQIQELLDKRFELLRRIRETR